MPPRKQPKRRVVDQRAGLDQEIIARRTKRHLEELERSNYAEPKLSLSLDDDLDEGGASTSKKPDRSRAAFSDKKRKSTAAVRRVLLYRKNLNSLIEESGIALLPSAQPTYLTAAAPPTKLPPRRLCSICGFWGHYICQKCGMAYCSITCQGTHNDTRCEKRVI